MSQSTLQRGVFSHAIACGYHSNEQISGDLQRRLSELFHLEYEIDVYTYMLNILIGSLLENEQDGEPVIVHDDETFSCECLTDGEWCSSTVCAVGDHVLLESKKEDVKNTLGPTQQELVVKASKEAGFSGTIGDGQFFSIANNLPGQDLSQVPRH